MSYLLHKVGFLFLAIFPFFINAGLDTGFYQMKVQNYQKCADHPDTKITFHNMEIYRLKGDQYIIKGDMKIPEKVEGPIYTGVYTERCDDERKPDSCKYLQEIYGDELCEQLKNPNSKEYKLVNNTLGIQNPRCPLPKGTYHVETQPIETNKKADAVYVIGSFFKFKMFFWEKLANGTKKAKACIYLEMKIEPKSTKERNRNFNGKGGR